VQPKKIIGASTRLNIRPMLVWPTLHPMVRPAAADNSATSRVMRTNSTGWRKLKSSRPRISQAEGKTTMPAASACTMPANTFSMATQLMCMGASRRSSISRVNWNSVMSGMATA
jgi:hypothetical protein